MSRMDPKGAYSAQVEMADENIVTIDVAGFKRSSGYTPPVNKIKSTFNK